MQNLSSSRAGSRTPVSACGPQPRPSPVSRRLLSKSPFPGGACHHHPNATTFAIPPGPRCFFLIGPAIQYLFPSLCISLSLSLYNLLELLFHGGNSFSNFTVRSSQKCNLFRGGIPLIFFYFLPLSWWLFFFAPWCIFFLAHLFVGPDISVFSPFWLWCMGAFFQATCGLARSWSGGRKLENRPLDAEHFLPIFTLRFGQRLHSANR